MDVCISCKKYILRIVGRIDEVNRLSKPSHARNDSLWTSRK